MKYFNMIFIILFTLFFVPNMAFAKREGLKKAESYFKKEHNPKKVKRAPASSPSKSKKDKNKLKKEKKKSNSKKT